MAKSLRKQLTDAADLVAILGLTGEQASVRVDSCGISFHLRPLDLAKVSRQLEVPRKKIEVSEHEYQGRISIHVNFSARGAGWCTVIWKEKLAEFYAAMGVEPVKRLTAEPLALPGSEPKRLTSAPKRLTQKRNSLFPAEMEDHHG